MLCGRSRASEGVIIDKLSLPFSFHNVEISDNYETPSRVIQQFPTACKIFLR